MVMKRSRLTLTVLVASALLCSLTLERNTRGLLAQNAATKTAPAVPKKTKADEKPVDEVRAADATAIRTTMLSFGEAFQKGDAPAAAAFLTSGAELIALEGITVRGRDAIQEAFTNHFSKDARPKIHLDVGSLDFPSRDTAVQEGVMKITAAGGEHTTNNYSVLLVREDGKWYLASIREWALEKSPLEELEWLIGSWSAKGKDAEAQTTYEWFGNKTFIKAQFSIREKETTVTGMQLIGIDQETGNLRTWTFEADGGYGEGVVNRDGNKWVFETATALTDRRLMTSSNILIHVDKNTFTWQPIDLTIDGEQIANLPPVKVLRVEAKK
ncbi:MAG: SnoaL-like domain protein [Planctomycetaceae bacterium]|nr:SnoaL-like domain protein [Planctomycetaceae bacterium]